MLRSLEASASANTAQAPAWDDQRARVRQLEALSLFASTAQRPSATGLDADASHADASHARPAPPATPRRPHATGRTGGEPPTATPTPTRAAPTPPVARPCRPPSASRWPSTPRARAPSVRTPTAAPERRPRRDAHTQAARRRPGPCHDLPTLGARAPPAKTGADAPGATPSPTRAAPTPPVTRPCRPVRAPTATTTAQTSRIRAV